jgi:hypothetical protein
VSIGRQRRTNLTDIGCSSVYLSLLLSLLRDLIAIVMNRQVIEYLTSDENFRKVSPNIDNTVKNKQVKNDARTSYGKFPPVKISGNFPSLYLTDTRLMKRCSRMCPSSSATVISKNLQPLQHLAM